EDGGGRGSTLQIPWERPLGSGTSRGWPSRCRIQVTRTTSTRSLGGCDSFQARHHHRIVATRASSIVRRCTVPRGHSSFTAAAQCRQRRFGYTSAPSGGRPVRRGAPPPRGATPRLSAPAPAILRQPPLSAPPPPPA